MVLSQLALNVFRRGRIEGVSGDGSTSAAANPLSARISFPQGELKDAQKPYGQTLENRIAAIRKEMARKRMEESARRDAMDE